MEQTPFVLFCTVFGVPLGRHRSANDLSFLRLLAGVKPASSALGNRRAAPRGRAINGGGVGFLIV
jgi:hypothetical protein